MPAAQPTVQNRPGGQLGRDGRGHRRCCPRPIALPGAVRMGAPASEQGRGPREAVPAPLPPGVPPSSSVRATKARPANPGNKGDLFSWRLCAPAHRGNAACWMRTTAATQPENDYGNCKEDRPKHHFPRK